MALGKDSSPVYLAFHHWLSKNRGKIKADANKTVIYSGMDSGGVPEWRKLADHARDIRRLIKIDPEWQPIEQVLSKLAFDLSDYKSEAPLPASALRFGSAWDFGCKAASKNYITRHESQQVWKNFSAWYVKNSSGHVWIWKGDVLKEYPDLMLAEIPVLMKRKELSPQNEQDLIRLVPEARKVIEKWRADSQAGRKAGR